MSIRFSSGNSRLHACFQSACILILASGLSWGQDQRSPSPPYFGNGAKVGEVDQTSAIVWTRLTRQPQANFGLLPIFTEGLPSNARSIIEMPLGVLDGEPGQICVHYARFNESFKNLLQNPKRQKTEWFEVDSSRDFTRQIKLAELTPATRYHYLIEARKADESKPSNSIEGFFETAPIKNDSTPIRFIVSTCQAVRSIDSGKDGHVAYKQMLGFKPHFFVHTGDILYYDKVPLSKNESQARAKWNLMFAYSHNQHFHQQVTSYFMKDDHDTLKNDCWPGQKYGDLTFQQGLEIFREQIPMSKKTYRTYRWGKDVQIWMTENRDFRSPNRMPDGPEKTILGAEQKAWLKKSITESDATFKFVISPGPIVGPDKKGKADNHSNANFLNEGQELRDFLSKQKNTFVICGDRHWQYCSKDPKTGLLELGCGPINDEHKFGGNPGRKPELHRYFSGKGGFLGITVKGKTATAEWFTSNEIDSKTKQPKVRYREVFSAVKKTQ